VCGPRRRHGRQRIGQSQKPRPTEALRQQAIALLSRHARTDGLHDCAVPGLQLIRASAPAQPLPALNEPGLVLVLQGR